MAITKELILIGLGMTAVGLLIAGILYQRLSEGIDKRKYPPPGQLVDVGGFRLHSTLIGQGTPTVVMDAGAGAPSISWGLVSSEIAKFTRVCIYDRAGFGWSEPNLKKPRTSQQSVDELHLLLTQAGIKPPYILVGHSLGGANMRLYASQYPKDVVGLVLVDSVHEDQMTPQRWEQKEKELWLYKAMGIANRFGVLRLVGELNLLPYLQDIKQEIQKYPPQVQAMFDTFKSYCYRKHYWATVYSEMATLKESFEQVRAVKSLSALPLIVLTQGAKDPDMSDERWQRWQELQVNLTSLSSNSHQVIASNSGHLIPLDQPELVVDAVHQLVERF